jgi:5-methylcytosine-specific restriction endonuclease McrA
MSAFQPWTGSHFKSDEDTRYERKRDAKAAAEQQWRDVCRIVDARDRGLCRACGRRCNPLATALLDRAERHHIVYRSAGGADESWCLVTVCQGCHNDEHRHRLRIEGNADVALTFYRSLRPEEWYIARQETAPHVLVPRD